ncbi:MAG TPA: hypothetical protein VE464_09525 [Streptosporangiaceae bacterium]|nr:hypothetical protein [Streptosporangiaceae bacterium]
MIDVDELRRMSPDERAELACALAALEAPPDADAAISGGQPGQPGPFAESDLPGNPRTRAFALIAVIGCGLVLAAWIGVLAVTLPRYYRSGGWRGAWVGFDLGLLITFAITAWAGWRHRQLVIVCLVVLATLLCCDAWFDVTLDLRTNDFLVSLLMALCVELPLAALAVIGARRLMRLNIRTVGRLAGRSGRVTPLWKVPLYGMESRGFRTLIPAVPCPPPAEPVVPDDLVPLEEPSRAVLGPAAPDQAAPGQARRAGAGVD